MCRAVEEVRKSGILGSLEGFIVTNNKGLRIVLGLQGYERVAWFSVWVWSGVGQTEWHFG